MLYSGFIHVQHSTRGPIKEQSEPGECNADFRFITVLGFTENETNEKVNHIFLPALICRRLLTNIQEISLRRLFNNVIFDFDRWASEILYYHSSECWTVTNQSLFSSKIMVIQCQVR